MATLNEEIEKLATLYKKLMTEDNTPDEEAQAKMEFLEIISNIEVMIGEKNEDLNSQIDEVKDKLLSWDPYGPWFKEQRELVKEIYNLITNVKKFKFSGEISDSVGADSVPNAKNLKNEIQALRSEVNSKINLINEDLKNIKKSITLIVKSIQDGKKNNQNKQEKKSKGSANKIPKPVPISSPIKGEKQRITKVPTVKPIGEGDFKKIKPRGEIRSIPIPVESEQANKPIPVQIPSTQKPAPIEPIQAPINLDNDSLEVEIDPKQLDLSVEPVEDESNLGNILSDRKETKASPRSDKDRLFNILSGQEASENKPASAQSSQDSFFEVVSPMNNQHASNSPPITIYSDDTDEEEFIELQIDEDTRIESIKEEPQKVEFAEKTREKSENIDPETLYQELINLEGKRYSLERSIRDLKRDREAGKISDNEYKSKLNKLLKDLQSISKRIEEIRDHLD